MDWSAVELAARADTWNLQVPEDLARASSALVMPDIDALDQVPEVTSSAKTFAKQILATIYDGPGISLLHGAPVDAESSATAWLWNLAWYLGHPVPQSGDGALVGRVEDVGADHANPTHRGHKTSAALAFHSDRTDVVALLCVRNAAHGGLSRLASADRVRAILASEEPELLEVLECPFPTDRRGEERPGETPWTTLPIFNTVNGRVVARYIRRFVESSQRHNDAPRLTAKQVRAMDAVDAILARPEVVYEMDLKAGQVQLIENHAIMHARSAFRGSDRLLLRLWLSTQRSPELPRDFVPVYGATAAGTIRGGVWPAGTDSRVGDPVSETLVSA